MKNKTIKGLISYHHYSGDISESRGAGGDGQGGEHPQGRPRENERAL